jgi:predicted aspartyl protease
MSQALKLLSPPGRACLALFAIGCLQMWVLCLQSIASQPTAGGLDSYLGQLGFEGVAFKQNERNHPLIEAEIGTKRQVFLVDTGCGMTILTPACAAGLKTLGELGVTLDDSALGPITNSSIALIDKLVLGRGQFINQPAWVQKLDMDFVRLQFDGILGLDFFFRNFCLIDCYRHKLYARASRPTKEESDAMVQSLRNSGFIDAPLALKRLLSVNATIKDHSVRLLVDTGDSVSALDLSQVTRLNLASVKWDEPTEGSLIRQDITGNLIGVGRIGTHKVWITMLSTFQIGSRTWKNVPYGVANLSDWGLGKQGSPEADLEGFLGNDVLQRYGSVIDLCNRKLWFRPEKGRTGNANGP